MYSTLFMLEMSNNPTSQKTLKRSFNEKREYNNLHLDGVEIENRNNEFLIHQKSCISIIHSLPNNPYIKIFRSMGAKLAWISQLRPDIACVVAFLVQVTVQIFQKDAIHFTNPIKEIVKHLTYSPHLV